MRRNCNYDSDDSKDSSSLETVLEVPVPEELFFSGELDSNAVSSKENCLVSSSAAASSWKSSMKHWMRSQLDKASVPLFGCKRVDLQILLGLLGAPLVPIPLSLQPVASIKNNPAEASSAQYIVQQYIAASGGAKALNGINNMYAMGTVKMVASEFESQGKIVKTRKMSKAGETGCFVIWQMTPDKWSMELMVSGVKLTLGSDAKRVWRQTAWLGAHPCRGPCRSLRRSIQGLDPRTTANLFSKARCVGEKRLDGEETAPCFLLKVCADSDTLQARSGLCAQIMKHETVGYFSQKTGLLVRLEDTHLMRLQTGNGEFDNWETRLESTMEDYRCVDGVMVAHKGHTVLNLYKYGDGPTSHTRTKMEECWRIREAFFNVRGLSMETFLPPAEVTTAKAVTSEAFDLMCSESQSSRPLHRTNARNFSKVASVDHAMDALAYQDRYYNSN